MDVFVDESGDLGFSKKATRFFIVAYLACSSSETTHVRTEMVRTLRRFHQRARYSSARNELKFSRMDDYCRKYVLEKIAECNVDLGIVALEKAKVLPKLRNDPTALYSWSVVHNIMLALIPHLKANKKLLIVFDKSLSMARINAFNAYVRNKASYLFHENGNTLPSNCISSDHFDSELEPCLQATDAVAGAYFQKYEKHTEEYAEIISEKVGYFKYLWK